MTIVLHLAETASFGFDLKLSIFSNMESWFFRKLKHASELVVSLT